MSKELSPIINIKDLILLKDNTEEIILIDASAGADAFEKYGKEHLEGSFHVDLDTQLADIKSDAANGGRHPLPTPEQFANVLIELGISKGSRVIIYDDKNCSNAAARFWWMLRSAGHDKIQVLDGGLSEAVKAGFPLTSKKGVVLKREPYNFDQWRLPQANINEVEVAGNDRNYLIIDVRDAFRYNGDKEPIDLIAGHIPGAINIPFTENLNSDGTYLSPEELRSKYSKIFENRGSENIIVHCGSGVTACHTILAMAYAGFKIPKLYVGSWSEWSRNNKPMVTKK